MASFYSELQLLIDCMGLVNMASVFFDAELQLKVSMEAREKGRGLKAKGWESVFCNEAVEL